MKKIIDKFSEWQKEAKDSYKKLGNTAMKEEEHNSVALATCAKDGTPSVGMVLLKKYDENGFVFYTNLNSQKGKEILENPKASMCFYWNLIGKQVRISGNVEQVSDAEADEYLNSREFKSKIGAHASKQSSVLTSEDGFMREIALLSAKYALKNVPRPEYWTGLRIIPEIIEFWESGSFRIHRRIRYRKENNKWIEEELYP